MNEEHAPGNEEGEPVPVSDELPRRRRWFQFRLRTLLAVVLVLSLPLSWLAVRMERARRQREAVEALPDTGAYVYDHQFPEGHISAPDDFDQAEAFVFNVTGLDVSAPDRLDPAHMYVFSSGEPPGPLWLRRLFGDDFFANVIYVILASATDSDLTHVAAFTHLEALELCGSNVTDRGINQLAKCSELRYLGLKRTKVTPEGVKKLQEALPDCKINY